MVICQICGLASATTIAHHVKTIHQVTTKEYKEKFPGFKLAFITSETCQKIKKSKEGQLPWNTGLKGYKNPKGSATKKGVPNLKLRGRKNPERGKNISKAKKAAFAAMTVEQKQDYQNKSNAARAITIEKRKQEGTYVAPNKGIPLPKATKEKITNSLIKTNAIKSQLIIDGFIKIANDQDLEVLSVEDKCLFNFRCIKCDTHFSFTRQIFIKSSSRHGKDICPVCYPRLRGAIARKWPSKELTAFQEYRLEVRRETKKQPIHLLEHYEKRGRAKGYYSLDHKYSQFQGFLDKIDPKIIGNIVNLEYIPVSKNSSKSGKCSIEKEELFRLYYK